MSKEVRLNDKMWYGKYKGRTIKSILESDRNFLDILINNGKISYNKNVLDYLNGFHGRKSMWEPRYYGSESVEPEPDIVNEPIGIPSNADDVWTADEIQIEMPSGQFAKIKIPKFS